jgi:protein-disulfide isomerase
MHAWARPAAEAAACAQEQGDTYFWKIHDYLFARQRDLTAGNLRDKLVNYAGTLSNFDTARFTTCIDQRQTAKKVEQDVTFGAESGIRATPAVFLNGTQVQVVDARA